MLDETKSFNSYLFTISKNTILNYFRKKANEQSYIEYIVKNTSLTYNKSSDELEYEELLVEANKIIDQLPPRQKEVYRLSREKGLKNEEIAQKLNISKKTVENQVTLAMKFLRGKLDSKELHVLLFISLFL